MKQQNFKILTWEELCKVRGGRNIAPEGVKDPYDKDSVADKHRKIVEARINKLAEAQELLQEAAIYLPNARGNCDSRELPKDVTWCNQATYDKMEETGVHTEAFYGKKGTRDLGYNVNANKAYDNVAHYIDAYAKNYRDEYLKKVPRGFRPLDENMYMEGLYEKGKQNCPIQELTPEQAQDYANEGYTVVAMWKNPNKGQSGHMSTVEGGHEFTDRNSMTIANIGANNKVTSLSTAFGITTNAPKSDIKFYVDTQQTFERNNGFNGLAYDTITKQQSISVNSTNYVSNDYKTHSKRNEIETDYSNGVKNRINELSELAKNGLELTDEQIDEYINGTVDSRIATARAGLAPGQSFAGMIGVGTADQLFTDMLELNNLRETLLAEQQRLEQQGTNTALLTGEQTATATVDEPTNNEENEMESSSDVSGQDNTDEYTADNSTNEQDNEHDDVGSGHGGQSEDDSNDQTTETSGDAFGDESEEQTETTTPIPNDETGDDTSTSTTTGDEQGSNNTGTSGSSGDTGGGNTDTGGSGTPGTGGGNSGNDNGGTPVAGGGGHHGPELGEAPDMWATSVGSPKLPDGFYVTRIAGLSSLNAAYEAAFEAGELDRNFFDEVSNLRTVQTVSLFARECEVN